MPWGLKRYQQTQHLHFVTFSCYRREPLLASFRAKHVFELALEQARRQYRFFVTGYVIMPEHVHLLISEPERATLAIALQALKQSVARRLASTSGKRAITTSMSGRRRSASRSCGTFTATRSRAGWWKNQKTGPGAVFATTRPAWKAWWKSNRSGQAGSVSGWECRCG